MTDNRKAGLALFLGSLGGLVTMAIHPHGGNGSMTLAQLDHLAVASAVAHSLAMVSVLLSLMGVCGLARYSWAPDRLSFAGLIVYGFATVSTVIGTAVSGFIVPHILHKMLLDVAANQQAYHIVLDAVFQFNQTFSQMYSVGASVAIVLFSVTVLRQRRMGRGLAVYGCIAGTVIALAVGSGLLRLNVHGMLIVVFAHAIWTIGAGAQLLRQPDALAQSEARSTADSLRE